MRRRELGFLLRRHREATGFSSSEVADIVGVSASQISRLETAQRAPSVLLVRELCQIYRLDAQTTDSLIGLARESREAGWWHRLDLEPSTVSYLSLESGATAIADFASMTVPGLLQTPEYARAVISSLRPDFGPGKLAQTIESRIKQQQILTAESPVELHAIVDESVLLREIGGPEIMRGQLEKLVDSCVRPNVTFQVLPFSVGAGPATDGSFTLLDFAEETITGIAYAEGPLGQIFIEKSDEVSRCRAIFAELTRLAASPSRSLDMLGRRLRVGRNNLEDRDMSTRLAPPPGSK